MSVTALVRMMQARFQDGTLMKNQGLSRNGKPSFHCREVTIMNRMLHILLVFILLLAACGKQDGMIRIAVTDGVVKVAVIDTGISTVAIAPDQLLPGYNYALNNTDTEDTVGHGTAVASVILGSEPANVTGIAPKSKVIPLVVKSRGKDGEIKGIEPAALAQVIRDAVDQYQANVINVSIGVVSDTKELRAAVEYADKSNVTVVASVGNGDANGDVLYPAAYPTVIGVGSVDKDNRVSSFSQKSSAVMIVAQGEDIWMASKNGKRYGAKGTSYATPFVSGAIALLLEANPDLSPAKIRNILCESALDLYDDGYDETSGCGVLQIDKALEMAVE